jgi:tetratricopeptide (TPR) repeat protein
MARWQGDYNRAEAYYRESLNLLDENGDAASYALVFHNLGYLADAQKHRLQARTYFRQSLALFHQTARLSGVADCAIGLARVAVADGEPARAARLLGFAETTRGAIITPDEYVMPSRYEVYDSLLATLPAQLLPTQFEAARAAGRALSLDQGIDYALGDDDPAS